MKTALAMAIGCLAWAASASAADYWPMQPGVTYVYQDELARTVTIDHGGGVRHYAGGCTQRKALAAPMAGIRGRLETP